MAISDTPQTRASLFTALARAPTAIGIITVDHGFVRDVGLSPDGTTLYTIGGDGRVIAWDLTGTRGVRHTFRIPGGVLGPPRPDSVHPGRFSPDGTLIAVGLRDRGIALWNAADLTPAGVLMDARQPRADRRRMGRVPPGPAGLPCGAEPVRNVSDTRARPAGFCRSVLVDLDQHRWPGEMGV